MEAGAPQNSLCSTSHMVPASWGPSGLSETLVLEPQLVLGAVRAQVARGRRNRTHRREITICKPRSMLSVDKMIRWLIDQNAFLAPSLKGQ